MSTYGFDGLDIDWEYPGAVERNGRPEDFANFVSFMRNLRSYFQNTGHNYGVTITLPTSFWYMQHFDIVNLEKYVDWFNMMSYDLAGTWDAEDVWRGPLVRAHTNLTEIDQALKLLWRNNINPANVVLGLGFYGRSFTLKSTSCKTTGCEFSEGGPPGECTGESGTLSYSEIQRRIAKGAKPVLDSVAAVQTLVYDTNYWVSYDDATTFKMKYDYANRNCLGGMMVWAASLDTIDAAAASALRTTQAVDPHNFRIGVVLDTTSSCVWTNCGEGCPSNYAVAALSGGGQATSGRRCGKGVTRSFCCPSNNLPTCSWNLYQNGAAKAFGVCQKKCDSGQIAVGTDTHGCTSGHGTLCCENKLSVSYIDQCSWSGSSPFCASPNGDASCPGDKPTKLTHSSSGDGGEQTCFSGWKSLCCTQPPPYTNCGWYKSAKWYDWFFALCDGTCPSGKTVVAIDPWAAGCTGWGTGPGAYCCDPPNAPGSNSNPTQPTDPTLVEWETSVKGWLSTGVCQIESGTDDPDLKRLRVRSLQENGTLVTRQALDPKWQNTAIAAKLLLIISQSQNNQVYSNMGATWDRLLAAAGAAYNQLTIANLRSVMNFPFGDRQPVLSQILCDRDDAQRTVVGMLHERSQVCQVPPGGTSARIKARTFTDNFNADHIGTGRPAVGRVLRAVASGALRPEYYRWFRYQGGAPGQFMMEGYARPTGYVDD
ncbi:Chitotriosidase-1 [Dactylellina cionopaga]|nr:Chitotriosidase-1 [Dactylellina cionopaga]